MKGFAAIVLIPALAIVPVFAQTANVRNGTSTLQVSVDLVLLDVSVQDRDGRPVRNLQPNDFRIYEDKIEQPISTFSTEESSVSWGLVLDRSSSMRGMIKEVHDAALDLVDQGTKDDDKFIMTFNRKPEIVSAFTADRRTLADSIVGLQGAGGTALYDAVDAALDYVKEGEHEKKVLVVVTDGTDNRSRASFDELMDRVKESDVLIYTVGMFDRLSEDPGEIRSIRHAREELEELAEMTGGDAHFPDPDNSREVMDKIAREVSEHYTIGYYAFNPSHDSRWRKLKVTIAPPFKKKYIVHARKGYVPPGRVPPL